MKNKFFHKQGISLLLILFLVFSFFAAGCDDLEEKDEETVDLDVDDDDSEDDDDLTGWDYPYYLIIGGALSETLSLLAIKGPDEFVLSNDVQLTGSAVNETLAYGDSFYAVCSLSNSVVVYDLDDLSIEKEVSVGTGNNPMNIAFYEEDKAYLSNYLTNTVTYYDLSKSQGELLDTIQLPASSDLPKDDGIEEAWARPGGMTLIGDTLFVALSNLGGTHASAGPGLVAAIDTQTNQVDSIIELEGRDTIMVLPNDEQTMLYAVSAGTYDTGNGFLGNGVVEIIDASTMEITNKVQVGGAPFEMTIAPNGIAYLGNGKEGKILSFDTQTLEVKDPIDIRSEDDELGLSFASALAVDGNGLLYATEFNHDKLFVIDTEDENKVIASFTVNDGPDTLGMIR